MEQSYRAEIWIFLFLMTTGLIYYALSTDSGSMNNLLMSAVFAGFFIVIVGTIISTIRGKSQ